MEINHCSNHVLIRLHWLPQDAPPDLSVIDIASGNTDAMLWELHQVVRGPLYYTSLCICVHTQRRVDTDICADVSIDTQQAHLCTCVGYIVLIPKRNFSLHSISALMHRHIMYTQLRNQRVSSELLSPLPEPPHALRPTPPPEHGARTRDTKEEAHGRQKKPAPLVKRPGRGERRQRRACVTA